MTSRSPFPGMDLYLETRWSDVHVKLAGFIGEAIQPLLPRELRARSEERILLELDEESTRSYRADIAVVESAFPIRPAASSGVLSGNTVVADPIVIRRFGGPMLDRWVQIIDVTNGNRVVTAIEILSPWNKAAGRLNGDYLRKLDDYARGNVSVVEIDLLRYPPRGRLPVTDADIPLERRTAYVTCIRLAWEPDTWRLSDAASLGPASHTDTASTDRSRNRVGTSATDRPHLCRGWA